MHFQEGLLYKNLKIRENLIYFDDDKNMGLLKRFLYMKIIHEHCKNHFFQIMVKAGHNRKFQSFNLCSKISPTHNLLVSSSKNKCVCCLLILCVVSSDYTMIQHAVKDMT